MGFNSVFKGLKAGDLRQTRTWLQIMLVFRGNWSLLMVETLIYQQNQYVLQNLGIWGVVYKYIFDSK